MTRELADPLACVDVTDPGFKADPFPFYARLRAEAPVFPVTLRAGRAQPRRAWLLTRYDEVSAALRDERLVKNRHTAMSPQQLRNTRMPAMFRSLERNLLALDGADHDRLRALVHRAFTPRRIEQVRARTQDLADRLLDTAQRDGGMDLISGYAAPLPLTIIGQILGVPDHDNHRFRRWTHAFVAVATARNPVATFPSILRFVRYLRRLIDERGHRPKDDLISALVKARDGDDRLTADEVLAMVFLLLSAGHETTVNLIGSGALALLQHPDQLARLRAEPDLITTGVEELLRFVVPAEMATQRYTREDVTIAGTTIPKGELVMAVIASANRDASRFDQPDALDLARTDNRHLSFGQGVHYCLGAPLSRLEGQIAISTLARRLPDLRLSVTPDRLRWRGGFIVRGLEALPVRC